MALKINTEPTTEPLNIERVKTHLRLEEDEHEEDEYIEDLIKAARKDCEAFQNRAYITQTWELWLDGWPDGDEIKIPLPPLASVSSVKYYDTSDSEATFSSDYYFVDSKSEPGRVVLKDGQSWPTTTLRPANGVCVTFVAGYGAASAVPENIKRAILLLIGHLYENRETVQTTGMNVSILPMGAEHLLWKDRVM